MGKKDCPEGKQWDSLVRFCLPISPETRLRTEQPRINLTFPSEPPMTAVDQLRATEATIPTDSVVTLSPFLWIFVVLATLGSILALSLWLVIYRRQSRLSSIPAEEAALELHHGTAPPPELHPDRNGHGGMFQRAAEASSVCHHLHQTGSKWEDNFNACRVPEAAHGGPEGGGGLPACSTTVEHRIPLPATELGGTALVTTKTV